MRITPSKWDAEYSWLTDEACRRSIGTSPMVTVDRGRWSSRVKLGNMMKRTDVGGMRTTPWWTLGMALQVMGVMTLVALSGIQWAIVPVLALTSMIGGEIIFIISKGHRAPAIRGERVK